MLSFYIYPFGMMAMLLATIAAIYIFTDRTPTKKPISRKDLQKLTRKEIDRYVKKSTDSRRPE